MKIIESDDYIQIAVLKGDETIDDALLIEAYDEVPLFIFNKEQMLLGLKIGLEEFKTFDVKKQITKLIKEKGLDPEQIFAHIGPSLSFEHIKGNDEEIDRLTKLGYRCVCKCIGGIKHLDLQLLIVCQLRELGLPIENIYQTELDTFEVPNLLYSKLRGDKKENRFVAYLIK